MVQCELARTTTISVELCGSMKRYLHQFNRKSRVCMTIQWPLCFLDIEASSLDDESYPIEVGVSILTHPSAEISTWSALIAPTPRWLQTGRWSARAEAVHGIRQSLLIQEGNTPAAICEHLNLLLASASSVWCDGGDFDTFWLSRLFDAALSAPTFRLRDVGALLKANPQSTMREYLLLLNASETIHRAGPDAEHMLRTAIRSLGLSSAREAWQGLKISLFVLNNVQTTRPT